MKSLFKRVAVGALAAAMLLSTGLTAMAHNEMADMEFVGYRVVGDENPAEVNAFKVYNESRNGVFTNKQVYVPVAEEDLVWKKGGNEAVYPYAGYDCLHIEGNKQPNITRYNGLTPQWPTKKQDYAWEIAFPHTIWERQMTKVNNAQWTWDFGNKKFDISDFALCTPTVRNATVEYNWETYGTAIYDNNGNVVTSAEEIALYNKFNGDDPSTEVAENNYASVAEEVATVWGAALETILSPEALSTRDDLNRYVVTDEMIQSVVPVVRNKFVTGKYSASNDRGLKTRDVIAEYKENGEAWERWDGDSLKVEYIADIDWTAPEYLPFEPYSEYQYLIVNGIVLDGSLDANGVKKDLVYRFTGSLAAPKVEWKFFCYELADNELGDLSEHTYEIVERKYIDGVKALDVKYDSIFDEAVEYNYIDLATAGNVVADYVYRTLTDEYGKGYFVPVEGGFEYWIAEDDGSNAILWKTISNIAGVEGADWSFAGASNLYYPVVK